MAPLEKPRDLALLDAIDGFARTPISTTVWRAARTGRDPLAPSRSKGRWSDGSFDILYTARARDGAIAEIFALLSDQPVFPSKATWSLHRLSLVVSQALVLPDVGRLSKLGVDGAQYKQRRYERTQEIAEIAFFLGFDAIDVPSARWPCRNIVALTEHLRVDFCALDKTEQDTIDWQAWRDSSRQR